MWFRRPGRRRTIRRANDNIAFGEDVQRGYKQYAFFGSFDFDLIPKVLTLTAGTRYYNYNEHETGSQYPGQLRLCRQSPNGAYVRRRQSRCEPQHDLQRLQEPRQPHLAHHQDAMVYYTFSQGFRPGGFNRMTSPDPATYSSATATHAKVVRTRVRR